MIKLSKHDTKLSVDISGLDKSDFQDSLQRVKAVPGRRWNPDNKTWEFPLDSTVAQRLLHTLQPEIDIDFQIWLKQAKSQATSEISVSLPADAEIELEWADELYPYQRSGIEFLLKHKKAILADDLGLGKTVQAISTVCSHYRHDLPGPVLVVCPNSVTGVWKREVEKWSKGKQLVEIINGRNAPLRKKQLSSAVEDNRWIVINWEKLRIMPELADIKWCAVIADEAHRAKNRKAQQTKALWKLRAELQLALSGTPLMNSPSELWALLKWIEPTTYTSYWAFYDHYVDFYEGYFGKVETGVRDPDALRFELANKLARRTKAEVLDLPEITRQVVSVPMKPYQRKLYETAEKELWIKVAQEATEGDTSAQKLLENPGELFLLPNAAARCTRLRQIASSPSLLGGDDVSCKLDAAVEIIKDADPSKQFVVFSLFKDTVKLLESRLESKGISCDTITGDTDANVRTDIINRFQNEDFRVIVMTQATGGVGITLTAADTVIFVEQSWVPADNEQAEARLHRIGQVNNVQSILLQAENTLDDGKVATTNRAKELIVGSVITTDEVKYV
jgi:SNF2 family DNA or RNA helicase